MKFLNKYFPAIMVVMICLTILTYGNRQKNINNFIKNSQECVVVLDGFDENQKDLLRSKLKKLTFQEVKIEETNGMSYLRIKCPPEKFLFFRKWILENKENK